MSAKRSMLTYAAGAASAAVALVASPGTYEVLRRRVGLAGDRHHYEDPAPGAAFGEPDPAAAADVRLSLRARLAENAVEDAADASSPASVDASRREPTAAAPGRAAVEEVRSRVRAKARAATERLTSSSDTADGDRPATER